MQILLVNFFAWMNILNYLASHKNKCSRFCLKALFKLNNFFQSINMSNYIKKLQKDIKKFHQLDLKWNQENFKNKNSPSLNQNWKIYVKYGNLKFKVHGNFMKNISL
jgi:hypothetical protein